jgi:hypothetical protein
VSGVTGLFRSTDQGATWLRLNDDEHEFGGASFLVGDMNVAGRVYMSAGGGRGVIYWQDVNTPPDPGPVTGIHDEEGNTIQMYPNPTASAIVIPHSSKLTRITILDSNGRTIRSEEIKGESTKVSLDGLPAGIYLIELVDSENTTTVRRVVKE